MSEDEHRRITAAHPAALLDEYPDFKVQIVNGSIVPVRKQVLFRVIFRSNIFDKHFMVLATMGNILMGLTFFKTYSVTLDLVNKFV